MKHWYFFLTLALAIIVAAFLIPGQPAAIRAGAGSIAFSHATHKDADCGTCHAAATSTSACDNLLPKPEVCAGCHEAADVRGYWSLGETDPLDKDYLQPGGHQLYFNHAMHAGDLKQSCDACHAGVRKDEGGMPRMDACSRCHNDGNAVSAAAGGDAGGNAGGDDAGHATLAFNRCEMCHVTLAGLRPSYHQSTGFRRMHGRWADKGADEEHCAACHSNAFCQSCHEPTNDVPSGSATAYYQSAWPRGEKMDDENALTVQSVHSLTYRYTHGFDARAQSSRCATCHEPESFCTPCHRNGYDATGTRIVPQSHQMAGFVTLNGSKALNRHATLAKMDLESCATCHDVDGADPVCAVCHSTGLVKGEHE